MTDYNEYSKDELIEKLKEHDEKEKERKKFKNRLVEKTADGLVNFNLGADLKSHLSKNIDEVRKGKVPSNEQIAELAESIIERIFALTRWRAIIYFLGILPAVLTLIIVFWQTKILHKQTNLIGVQNQKIENQNLLVEQQNKRLDEQTYLEEAGRRSSLIFLLNNISDQISKETKLSSSNTLSKQLTARIIALSQVLKPYKYLENDSLINDPVSLERGQLLLVLLESELADETYDEIFEKANFSYTQLESSKIFNKRIKKANIKKSKFISCRFEGNSLTEINCDECQFINCEFKGNMFSDFQLLDSKFEFTNFEKDSFYFTDFSFSDFLSSDFEDLPVLKASLFFIQFKNQLFLDYEEKQIHGSTGCIYAPTVRFRNEGHGHLS